MKLATIHGGGIQVGDFPTAINITADSGMICAEVFMFMGLHTPMRIELRHKDNSVCMFIFRYETEYHLPKEWKDSELVFQWENQAYTDMLKAGDSAND